MIEEGDHIVRFRGYIDLGTITDAKYKNRKREIKLLFEAVNTNEDFGDGQKDMPFGLSKKFTFSLAEKANFRKFFESWRGKKYETQEDLDKFDLNAYVKSAWPGRVVVVHKKGDNGTFAVIDYISPVPKKDKDDVPPLRNPVIAFRIDEKESHKDFKYFKHYKNDLLRLQQCEEFKQIAYLFNETEENPDGGANLDDGDEEDVPF